MAIKKYGDRAAITGDRQVPTLPSTKGANPPIQTNRWFRNGKHPDVSAFNQMNDHMNQAMIFRTKELFSILGDLGSAPGIQATSVVGTRNRWRFAFHLSPYTHALLARVVMFPPSSNYGNDTFAKLKIYSDATETTLVSTTEFHYGPGPNGAVSVGGWQYHRIVDKFIEGLTADADYFGLFTDETYGRLQSAAIADMQSMTENYSGYLPTNFTEQSQILDEYRQNLVTPMPGLWKRAGSKVLNWTANIQSSPQTIAVNTATNILDGTSTTYSSSIPGYTLVMTGKNRLSQTGVPCVVKAFMSCTSASNGVVHLRDSTGAIVATCTNTLGAGVTGWIASSVVNLTSGKYYLTHQTAAGTLSTYAVSIYEYEA